MRRDWIRLYRKLRKNPIWKKKPFTKGQAWVDLLLRANYMESKIMIGNQVIKILPGQIFTSEKHLAEDWGWSRQKLRHFEGTLLANDQICTPKKTSKYTILTITNWARDQSGNDEKDIKKDIKRTSNEHQKDTSKNYKNLKNDKEIKIQNEHPNVPENQEIQIDNLIMLYKEKFPAHIKRYGVSTVMKMRDMIESAIIEGVKLDDIAKEISSAKKGTPWEIISERWLNKYKKEKKNYDKLIKRFSN